MNYLRQHPEFLEGPQYIEKYAQLLSRALALVKNQVSQICGQIVPSVRYGAVQWFVMTCEA